MTAISYALYCSSQGETLLILTVLPVIAGFYRYMRLVSHGFLVDRPEVMLVKDPVIAVAVVIWAALFALVIYW